MLRSHPCPTLAVSWYQHTLSTHPIDTPSRLTCLCIYLSVCLPSYQHIHLPSHNLSCVYIPTHLLTLSPPSPVLSFSLSLFLCSHSLFSFRPTHRVPRSPRPRPSSRYPSLCSPQGDLRRGVTSTTSLRG